MSSPIRKEFCTMAEAAEFLGVSLSQVSRYVAAGQLAAEKVGRQVFVKWSDVRVFVRPPTGNPNFRRQSAAHAN